MGDITIPVKFVNPVQEAFFYCNKRNQGFSGGFGNGKTAGGSLKALTLLTTFPKYRCAISRYSAKDLITSTMSTFFKFCPPELYSEAYGGRRNDRDGHLRMVNGSEIFWLHLDDFSEDSLRGLEVNSHLGDQMEEIAESIYLIMDSRIERWDQVEIPSHLNPEHFPKNQFTGKPMPPCYNMVLCNPDTTLHWIYRRYHPDSPEYAKYADTHAYFTASTHDNPAIPQSLKNEMLKRDPSWVDRYYWGKWGIAGGSIHYVHPESILEPTSVNELTGSTPLSQEQREKLLNVIQRDGIKFRVMDHGDAAPTCCLWFAYLSPRVLASAYDIRVEKGIHICYREYYQPEKLISYHREQIAELSRDERYHGNYADPAIFKKQSQKNGGWWSVAEEYLDKRIKAPPIAWLPADNNEMATRNAVSEMLGLDTAMVHFLTKTTPAPLLYFLKRSHEYPNGCNNIIHETQSARRKKIGSVNGQDVYSDERVEGNDHAYDPLRYYSVMPRATTLPDTPIIIPQFSFAHHVGKQRIRRMIKYKGQIYGG